MSEGSKKEGSEEAGDETGTSGEGEVTDDDDSTRSEKGEEDHRLKEAFEREAEIPAPESRADRGDKSVAEAIAEELETEIDETPKEKVKREVADEVEEYFDTEDVLDIEFPSGAESVSGEEFFSFEYLDEYDEVERYWADKPYSYVSILFDPDEEEFLYHVNEPHTNDFQEYIRDDVKSVLRDLLIHEDPVEEDERRDVLEERMSDVFEQYVGEVQPETFYKTRYYLLRDFVGYGKVDAMMRDRGIEDISCDGPDVPIFVYHRNYRDLETNVVYEESQLNSFVLRLAQQSDKHVSVANPMADASLPDGSRIQMTLGREVSSRGSNFTIRRFRDVPSTPIDLIRWGTFSAEQMAYFWLAIQNNMSLIFAGGTASGKTTSMNAISLFIPRKSKVITIEDTREVMLPHENWVQGITRESPIGKEKSDIGMYELLEAALRQRPEYLLVGEVRTDPKVAQTFFQAMATGHTSYTTFHADSVKTVVSRMQNEPINVPPQMLRELDIVAVQKQVFRAGKRVRRNIKVAELGTETEREDDDVGKREIFEWDSRGDRFERLDDSAKMRDIMDLRGWDEDELRERLERRAEFLRILAQEGIVGYEEVVGLIRRFEKDPDSVLEEARDGRLG
jgi:flagellar protein FlaI